MAKHVLKTEKKAMSAHQPDKAIQNSDGSNEKTAYWKKPFVVENVNERTKSTSDRTNENPDAGESVQHSEGINGEPGTDAVEKQTIPEGINGEPGTDAVESNQNLKESLGEPVGYRCCRKQPTL
jgi:hypothetical protein